MEKTILGDRYNDGKIDWTLVDFKSLEDLVKVMEFGAKKYSRDNWRLGLEVRACVQSLMRHCVALADGEYRDKESGETHVGHAMFNLMAIAYMMRNRPDLDNHFFTEIREIEKELRIKDESRRASTSS